MKAKILYAALAVVVLAAIYQTLFRYEYEVAPTNNLIAVLKVDRLTDRVCLVFPNVAQYKTMECHPSH